MLQIEGTYKTPSIYFNPEEGTLIIKGRSIPENPIKVYQPLLNTLENYTKKPAKNTKITIFLDYLNTHSTEILMLLFNILKEIKDRTNLTIVWQYEQYDEDMQTMGEDFQVTTGLPITLQEIPEEQ